MKYKKWISETDIRKPEVGEIYHCILVDKYGELPPYQEIMLYENLGWTVQHGREEFEHIQRYRIAFWRSIPDYPDMKEVNEKIKKKIRTDAKSLD